MKKLIINGLIVVIFAVVILAVVVGLLKNVSGPQNAAEEGVQEEANSMDLAGDATEKTSVKVVEKEQNDEFSLDLSNLDELEKLT